MYRLVDLEELNLELEGRVGAAVSEIRRLTLRDDGREAASTVGVVGCEVSMRLDPQTGSRLTRSGEDGLLADGELRNTLVPALWVC